MSKTITSLYGEVIPVGELEGKIIPALWPFAVRIDSLKADETNARNHNDENIAAITGSLKKYGQDVPIVCQQSTRVIRKGNGRTRCMELLSCNYIAAVFVDEEDVDAVGRALADNRASDLASWNKENLKKLLGQVKSADKSELGFSKEQVSALFAVRKQKPASSKKSTKPVVCCPKCKHKWRPA